MHPQAGEEEQAKPFIDDIWTVGAHGRAQAQEGLGVVANF